MKNLEHRPQWYSFTSYVLVTTGAMVGLGNVFQFPFLVVKYGGLFVLFYVICQLAIALPILFTELLIGRRGKQNPVGSISLLTMEADASHHWRKLGWACIFISLLTMIYYTVLSAFPIGYFIDNIKDIYQHTSPINGSLQLSNTAVANFTSLEMWFVLLLLMAMIVVCRGIHRGLEEISMITVPLYGIILLALAIYVSTLGYLGETISHFFVSDPTISFYEVFLVALALSFMKYKIGMGVMIVYGSYLPYHVPLAKSTLCVIVIDALVSLLSYFIVYPLTIASSPDENLMVLTSHNVINIFDGLPGGLIISAIFFFAAILIVWTPIIAMAETIVVTFTERFYWSRAFASLIVFLSILIFGSFEVATHLQWADVSVFGYPLHDLLRNVTRGILMPIVVFFIAIFAGWIMAPDVTETELHFKPVFYRLWQFLIRFVVPFAVLGVLLSLGVSKL